MILVNMVVYDSNKYKYLTFLVEATNHTESIVREEPPVVQSDAQQLRHRRATHHRAVAVLISGEKK